MSYFRFFLNIDECLRMADYKMFFYRLEHEKRFQCHEVQLMEDGQESSLDRSFAEIRTYLRNAFKVPDYQIIAAMRMDYRAQPDSWRSTLLYRLLRLWYELHQYSLFIGSEERLEGEAGAHVLSVIVLYHADYSSSTPQPPNYMTEQGSLRRHLRLLLKDEYGFDLNADFGEMDHEAFLQKLRQAPNTGDPAVKALADAYLKQDSLVQPDAPGDGNLEQLVALVQQEMKGYHLEEELLDQNNLDNEIVALLRLVEFISPADGTTPGEGQNLHEYCKLRWRRIWEDQHLQERYSNLLWAYRERPKSCRKATPALEEKGEPFPLLAQVLPEDMEGAFLKIHSDEDEYAPFQLREEKRSKQVERHDLNAKLELFRRRIRRSGGNALKTLWKSTCEEIRESLEDLKGRLKGFARELSETYQAQMQKQSRERQLEQVVSDSDDPVEAQKDEARKRRKECWDQLKRPMMNPTVSYQDELNVLNVLNRCNSDICFQADCLKKVRPVSFLLLILLLAGVGCLHYGFLQPYVFTDRAALPVYLVYVLASGALMLLAWKGPERYFKGRIRASVRELQEAIGTYIKGYYDRGYYFYRYINTMNDLNILSGYLSMIERVTSEHARESAELDWHRERIAEHLNTLNNDGFRNLIDLADERKEPVYTPGAQDWKTTCVHSEIYWPQQ